GRLLSGVVCKQVGQWIVEYNWYLGFYSIFYAELWGILYDLTLIQREGHKKVLIDTNNLKAVEALQDVHLTKLTSVLIRRMHMTLQTIEQWEIKYIPRERNQVADQSTTMTSERNSAM
ncbi:hypothetical protein Godav_013012, partial [Gossypium davidsonii]|nr:hypothetical protein [Gossypium davidsonii]